MGARRIVRGLPMAHDAFISYSHAADGQLAPALQRGLQRLAKPWNRRRALHIFRDETGLSTNPHLWSSVETALDESHWFILLASPEAAASEWVNKEIEHWLITKDADHILPVLTDGTWAWDTTTRDYTLGSTAVPQALRGALPAEPRHLDLRWARTETDLDLRNSRFRDAVADLAAPMHGVPKDELEGEDIRQHRHTRRLVRGAEATLALLLIAAVVAGALAVVNARDARREAVVARSRGLAGQAVARAHSAPDLALLLAVEAHRHRDSAETRGAVLSVLQRTATVERRLTGFPTGETVSGLAPDGSLAVGDGAGRVTIIDVKSGKRRVSFDTGHRGHVKVFFSPDGKTLATGAQDTTVRLWRTDDGRPASPPLRAHEFPVSVAAFSPDGRLLATEDEQGWGFVWEISSGRRIASIPRAVVSFDVDVAFSADGRRLAVTGSPTTVFDVATMTPVFRAPAHSIPDWAIAWSSNGLLLAIADEPDSVVELRDAESGELRATLPVPKATYVNRLLFAPDGSKIVGGLGNGSLVVWNLANPAVQGEPLPGHADAITRLSWGGEGRELTSASATGAALWNLDRIEPVTARVRIVDGLVLPHVEFRPDGRMVATQDAVNRVYLLDARGLRPLGEPIQLGKRSGTSRGLPGLAFSPNGRSLVVSDSAGTLFSLDVNTRRITHPPLALPIENDLGAGSVDVSPDGRWVGVAGEDGSVTIVDVERWSVRRSAHVHGSKLVNEVAFSPDGKLLASGGTDGRLVLERLADGHRTTVLSRDEALTGLDFSPNGRSIVAGFGDGTALIVDVATHEVSGAPLVSHGGVLFGVRFSPDGQVLALGGLGRTVTFYDVRSQQAIGDEVAAHQRVVGGVAFAPDGTNLLSVGAEGSLVRWELDPGAWARRACAKAGRNLTRHEWLQYVGNTAYRKTCAQWPAA